MTGVNVTEAEPVKAAEPHPAKHVLWIGELSSTFHVPLMETVKWRLGTRLGMCSSCRLKNVQDHPHLCGSAATRPNYSVRPLTFMATGRNVTRSQRCMSGNGRGKMRTHSSCCPVPWKLSGSHCIAR
ncbi:hypothetical protein GCM10023347_15190 [Streptomyces chumphonensis]